MERTWDQRRWHLELKLDEDLTIDEERQPWAPDAATSSRLDAARLALAEGNWTAGFADFEHRPFASPSDRPRWNGTRSPAARLVVVAEEDECDTLAFARFLPALAGRVLSLTFAVPVEQMARLSSFAAAFGGLPLIDVASLPPHDLVLPLASAPAVLGLSPDDVPPPRLLPAAKGNRDAIGVALASSPWSPSSGAAPDGIVTALRRAFPGVRLVALDKAAAQRLGSEAVEADPATLAGLDLVVATDGPVAHAAGIVGVPLWLLLEDAPHWMWGREGRLSRWYPAARLFRADGPGWRGIADDLAAEVMTLSAPGLSDAAALSRLAAAAEGVDGAAAARAALPFAARLLALAPTDPEAWARLAGLSFRLGAAADADRALAAGLAAGPRHTPLLLLAARRDLDRNRPASALHRAEQALGADPAFVEALTARAAALAALGEPVRAEFALRQAVQMAPRQAGLLVAWGEALRALGDIRAAGRAFERAAIAQDGAEARLGLGRLAAAAGETGLALHFLQSAVARDDNHTEAAMEFARGLSAVDRTGEAIDVLRRLVARRPSAAARALLGELLLASGDFPAGLAEFEWRRGESRALPALADLAGRNVVLMTEGDAGVLLRFLRFAAALKAAGAVSVHVAGAADLTSLLSAVDGLDGAGEADEGQLVLPVMSLPKLLGLVVDDLSAPPRYLAPDSIAVTTMARQLADLDGFRVGLALDGLDAAVDVASLVALPGVTFVALDAGATARLPEARPLVTEPPGLDRVAAALPNLDAVVAPSASPVAVLAGTIGRPVFVIGPDRDDWLWLEREGRTPWFSAMRLFRRHSGEGAAGPLSRLVAALAAFAGGDRAILSRFDPAPADGASLGGDEPLPPGGALVSAGLAALSSRDDHRAILLIGDAIAAGAVDPDLRERLAAALLRIGEHDRAGSLLAALAVEAPTAERLSDLSHLDRLSGRVETALAHAERAVELRPDLARAHRAVGKALVALGRASEALAAYGRAVTLAPTDPELVMDEAEALLISGDYRRGFARAEVRWQAAELLPRRFAAPRWTGEDIGSRTLLVHGERDLGTDIAFARFLPRLLASGARLVIEVRPALTDLFRRLDLGGDVTVVEQGRRLPPHDLEVPLRSLPHVFGTERAGLPPPAGFQPDPMRIDAWRRVVGNGGQPAIGLYWRSAADAALYASLADLDGVRLFALDRRAGRAMLAALPKGLAVQPLGDRLGGFVETAAAMAALDVVVAPASTTAHLAATLGRPTVVVDPPAEDWLWAGDGGTPWYPAARILRRGGDLAGLLRDLAVERPAP